MLRFSQEFHFDHTMPETPGRGIGSAGPHRVTPLTAQTAAVLRVWQHERAGNPDHPLFPTSRSGRLSRDAVAWPLAKHVTTAARL